MDLPAALERRHALPAGAGDAAAWREAFDVAFWTPRGTFGGHLTLLVGPGPRCCYWTSVLEEGRPVVTVVEHDVAVPRAGGLEVRAQGLWADQNCEEPFVHWSYGLEAFALRVDRPEDAIGDGRGERVGLGYDLEWEAVPGEPPVPLAPSGAPGVAAAAGGVDAPGGAVGFHGGYRQPGRFHGEILVGADTYELDAAAVRSHWWGAQPWPGVDSGPQPPDEELVGRCLAEVPGDGVLGRRLVRGAEVASLRTYRPVSA